MGPSPGDVITKAAQSLAKEKERQRKEKGGGTEGGREGGESGTAWKEWGLVRPRKEVVEKHYKLGKKVRRRKKGREGGSKGGLTEKEGRGARGQG